MKLFLLLINYLWIALFAVEVFLCLVFFNFPPFPGFLATTFLTSSVWNFLLRLIFTFGFVSPIALRSNANAIVMGAYHFFLGLYCFMNYLDCLLLPHPHKNLRISNAKYIQIKILVSQFNDIFSQRVFIKTFLPAFLVPFLCLYVVCKFHSDFSLLSIILLLVIVTVI